VISGKRFLWHQKFNAPLSSGFLYTNYNIQR
jgi:hypothetical protein